VLVSTTEEDEIRFYVKFGLLQMSGLQPSNSPIRSTVAELDWGGVHCEETRAALTRAAARVL
jgi:hypothetical protein